MLRRQNIAIDLVDHLAGPHATRWLVAVGDFAMLAMLGLMAAAMLSPAMQALDYGDRKLELGLPLFAVWLAALAGMAGCVLAALASLTNRPLPAMKGQAR